MLIAQADTAGAVKALNDYLAEFAADGEAWLQLAKLHIGALNYEVGERRASTLRAGPPWLTDFFRLSAYVCCCFSSGSDQVVFSLFHKKREHGSQTENTWRHQLDVWVG